MRALEGRLDQLSGGLDYLQEAAGYLEVAEPIRRQPFEIVVLIVQNRVIGLEMRLRLATVLPVELCQRIPELHIKQLVGLRYAGDDELVGLVERCLRGELVTADAVKREVRHWRPDYVRA